jgi:hypothetical protein
MTKIECEFEADVLAAVLQSRWPERADAELRAHVSKCEVCSDVALIASAIDGAREAAVVPEAGRIWWQSQLRARREAAEAAGRPITATQVVAFACAVGLIGAWLHSLAALDYRAVALAGAMAVLVLLVPAVVYFALGRD